MNQLNTENMTYQRLRFFASTPHDCGYFPGREAMSLFTDPEFSMTPSLYSKLVDLGFRRSGEHVYRPYCTQCHACLPARLDAFAFSPSRTQRRTWKKNGDISIGCFAPTYNDERFILYRKYVSQRHTGGEMDIPEASRYQSFISSSWCDTIFYEFRLKDKLIAVSVTDRLKNGLSAFYTYFDPDYADRGLGIYAAMWQIEEVKRLGLRWLYLGYWIEECRKMNYKSDFRPLEVYRDQRWQRLDPVVKTRSTTVFTPETTETAEPA